VIAGGPHGCNISHPDEFNEALVGFLPAMACRGRWV
jgi:pimeloyl-ACP methyl ester carboxylesterase